MWVCGEDVIGEVVGEDVVDIGVCFDYVCWDGELCSVGVYVLWVVLCVGLFDGLGVCVLDGIDFEFLVLGMLVWMFLLYGFEMGIGEGVFLVVVDDCGIFVVDVDCWVE